MKIVEPSFEILSMTGGNPVDCLKNIEIAGRECYKSGHRITKDSYMEFIERLVARGHESVLEHSSATARIVCDRGISHELVRHRLASYSQESTRYCNYAKDQFGAEISVIAPEYIAVNTDAYNVWENSCKQSEKAYFDLLNIGLMPQEARDVLPHSLKTEVVMSANMREWRHFIKLRTSAAAHPGMRHIARMCLEIMFSCFPPVFEDLYEEVL